MTAQCALYIMCPENFPDTLTTPTATIPQIFHGLLFRSTLWMFLQNLKSVALPIPEIIWGTQKIWTVPGYDERQSFWVYPAASSGRGWSGDVTAVSCWTHVTYKAGLLCRNHALNTWCYTCSCHLEMSSDRTSPINVNKLLRTGHG